MSQQDHFVGGFITGAIVGGIVGGVIGALTASRIRPRSLASGRDRSNDFDPASEYFEDTLTEETMEQARQGLEVKIAQLNQAIDEVRQQMEAADKQSFHQSNYGSRLDG